MALATIGVLFTFITSKLNSFVVTPPASSVAFISNVCAPTSPLSDVPTSKIQGFRAKGNNTYQIVYTGNSDIAMDGAGVR